MTVARARGICRSLHPPGHRVEQALTALILIGIAYCAVFLATNGYLPPPFFYEPSDTFADWFNTAFWARDVGTYDVWRTVYPPLSFVFLRGLGLDRCYPDRRSYDFSAGLDARECDWLGLVSIATIFLVNLVLIWFALRKRDPGTALPRTICVALGLPMLSAIERGNLAIISFTCLLLCLGPLVRSARLRWIAAGLAINFKIYLIAAIVPLLLKRRWKWVECALLSVVIVYLLSYAMFGSGSPAELIGNIRDFSTLQSTRLLDVWYSTTYQSLTTLLQSDDYPMALIIGSRNADLLAILLPLLQRTTQLLTLLALLATWLRPETVPYYRVANLGILLALITSEAGGYSQIYFFIFVMMEPWRGFGRRWAIIVCYLLAVPLDISLDRTPEIARDTYFAATILPISYSVTLGPFLRPLLIMSVAVALALVTIREVWLDIRHQGWAGRHRFRRDVPLLPWVRRPEAPPA